MKIKDGANYWCTRNPSGRKEAIKPGLGTFHVYPEKKGPYIGHFDYDKKPLENWFWVSESDEFFETEEAAKKSYIKAELKRLDDLFVGWSNATDDLHSYIDDMSILT